MADYWNQNKPALMSAFRSIKQQASSVATRVTTNATSPYEPHDQAQLEIYPTYAYTNFSKEYPFSITIRGWLFVEGDLSKRRNKLLLATTERFVGNSAAKTSDFEEELVHIDDNKGTASVSDPSVTRSSTNTSYGTSSTSPSVASQSSSDYNAVLRQRIGPFFRKNLSLCPINIEIYGANGQQERFVIDSDSDGRFEHTFTVAWEPKSLLAEFEGVNAVIYPEYVAPDGISVISDIDDTVRLTGILNGKRDTLRNVLTASFDKVKLKGVSEWYQAMAHRGATFHYVSNSPWQMYNVVTGFLKSQNFPKGSMHLKRYQGLVDGLLEPVGHRKVKSLYRILDDFPRRKFILIGDGGELDLETYVQLAQNYPKQVLAIYIRDLILPLDEKLDFHPEPPASGATNTTGDKDDDSLIDLDNPHIPAKNTKPGRSMARKFDSKTIIQTIKASSRSSSPRKTPHHHPSRQEINAELNQKTVGGVAGALFGAATRPGAISEVAHMARESLNKRQGPPKFVSSSQDYSEYERLDKERKRIDSWKARVIMARNDLPKNVELKLWRDPDELSAEALRKVSKDLDLL